MSKRSASLRALVTERLTAAVEDIFALVERTIAEYEEELSRCREENLRNQQLLEENLRNQQLLEALSPQLLLHRTDAQVQTDAGSLFPQQESPQIEEPPVISAQTFNCSIKTESEEQRTANDVDTELSGLSAVRQLKTETDRDQNDPAPSLPSAFEYRGCSTVKTPPEGADGDEKDIAKKHECCFCGRKFREERNLQRHIVVHTRPKPFVCPVCSRCFSQEETLRLHMALHGEGGGTPPPVSHELRGGQISAGGPAKATPFSRPSKATPFSCPAKATPFSCPAKATPFSCPVCHKCFTRTFSLQSHMLTHTGEKPFPCPLCSTRFNRKSNLNRHLKVHAQRYHNV